jgi:Putative Ig domain
VPIILKIIGSVGPLYRDLAIQINNFTNGMVSLSNGPYLVHGLSCGGENGVPAVPSIPPNQSAAWLFEKAAGSAYGPQGGVCFTLQYYDGTTSNTENFAVLFRIPDASASNYYYFGPNTIPDPVDPSKTVVVSAETFWNMNNGSMWDAQQQGTYNTTVGPFSVNVMMETTNNAVMTINIWPPSPYNPAFDLTCAAGTAGTGNDPIVLPAGTAGVVYPTYTIDVELPGGSTYEVPTYNWAPNDLPSWLQISPNSSDSSECSLSGNGEPIAGTYNFTLNATDGGVCPASSGGVPFQIVISPKS